MVADPVMARLRATGGDGGLAACLRLRSTVMQNHGLRTLFSHARVARLATVGADGLPHLVPITFALAGEVIYFAVDGKPKSTRKLRRLSNIDATGRACVLVDHYDDDWSRLWWVRVDGRAEVLAPDDGRIIAGLAALTAKYPQYHQAPPGGPVVAISASAWRGWSATTA